MQGSHTVAERRIEELGKPALPRVIN